jgi:hypothetical protein
MTASRRRILQAAACVAAAFAVTAAANAANADSTGPRPATHDHHPDAHPELAVVRAATAAFHDLDVARAAGWANDVTGCLQFPDGYMEFGPGAMGHHYLNVSAYLDGGNLDPATPEALLYEAQPDGTMRLTAVEYIIPEQDLPRTDPPPTLFGRQIHFHPRFEAWALHVWLWKANPYGVFADVNPRVECDSTDAD